MIDPQYKQTQASKQKLQLMPAVAVAAVVLLIVGLQTVSGWRADRGALLLLGMGNGGVSLLASWLFLKRWRSLGDSTDGRLSLVFVPIGVHFVINVALEALGADLAVAIPVCQVSWIVSQSFAVVALMRALEGQRTVWSPRLTWIVGGGVIAASVGVLSGWTRHSQGSAGADLAEIGLIVGYCFAAARGFLTTGGETSKSRWVGAGSLLMVLVHVEMVLSKSVGDGPFMWAHALLVVALVTPLAGAANEHIRLLDSQTTLSKNLRLLRRRTDALLDNLPALVLSVDSDCTLRYANSTASQLFGSPSNVGGDPDSSWLDRLHPEDQAPIRGAVASLISEGEGSWGGLVCAEGEEGGARWLNLQIHPVFDPVENEPLAEVVAIDITDLLLARKAGETRQSRLAFLSNVAQTVAGEVAASRVLTRFLEIGQEIYPIVSLLLYRPLPDASGLQLVAQVGPGAEVFNADRRHPVRAGDRAVWLAFQDGYPCQTAITDAHLDLRSIGTLAGLGIRNLVYLPLLAAGRGVGVLGVTLSSANRLAAEDLDLLTQVGILVGGAAYVSQLVEELEEQRALAIEASRLKSEFLANTSHELRTPLSAILGFLRLIIDGAVEDPAKQREFLTIAHESAEKLLRIINDVLDLAKIEAGHLEVHRAPIPIRRILHDVETLFVHQMKGKGVTFTIENGAANKVLWGDPTRIVQILTNLLSNSIKFTPRGGSVTLLTRADEGILEFAVQDTGIGIPDGELERVFSSFYQVDGSTTRHYGGTGLGLTISRRLAELMGGTLHLESAGRAQGTTARLRLEEYAESSVGS